MAEIPGARERLDESAAWLSSQVVALAGHLTPGIDPELFAPGEPVIVDWHEPLKFQYQLSARTEQPGGRYDRAIAGRAGELLAEAGWQVTEQDVPDADGRHTVAVLDGCVLRVRIFEGIGSVVYSAQTPAIALYTAAQPVRPDPVLSADTVRRGYVLCHECEGLGWCPACEGRGWITGKSGRDRCPECLGERTCPICRGAGQLAVYSLQDWQRDLYPELREQS